MNHKMTRKEALQGLVVMPALAGLLAAGTTAVAQAKGSQAQFKYQSKPKDGKQCSGCSLFIPGKKATAAGECKVVAGSISPHGWCVAYTPKT
ncbi:MAG: high-potential iron-sulfur protein [Vulcanimicrobiaceae bacterium]